MSKPKVIKEQIESGVDLDGPLENAIWRLQEFEKLWQKEGFHNLRLESGYGDDPYLELWGERYETQEEENARKAIAKEKNDKVRAKELAELTRLQKKYGKI